MEEASNNHVVLPNSEKKMDKKPSSSLGDGKESLKLRISTNHADGTSKIISNHGSSSHNHNHVSKEKDGIGKDDVSKSKHGHDGEKRKEHKHKAIKDSSHSEKHKSHSESHKVSSDSKKHNDSNSKPKENSHNSGSKDIKNKENSSSSKPKDGHNNSITKTKDSVSKSSDSKSSSLKDGGSKPKHSSSVKSGHGDQSTKTKVPSASLNHSAKENNINHTPKEHGSSSSSKSKESSKQKDSNSKPKEDGGNHKPKENSSSHKSKEHSSSKPRDNSISSKPKESGVSKPKESSSSSSKPKESGSSTKHSDSSSKHGASLNSTPKPKENGEKSSSSSSSKPKSSGDKISSNSSSKSKDASFKDKSISKSGEKLNSSSNQVKVKQEKLEGDKKHQYNKDSGDKKEHKKESTSKDKSKDIKPIHKIKHEVEDKSPEKYDNSFSMDEFNHKVNDSYKSNTNISMKSEPFSEEDVPLSARKLEITKQEGRKREQKTEKRYKEASDSEDEPLSARMENVKRLKKEQNKQTKKRKAEDSDDEPISKKTKKTVQNKKTQNQTGSPTKSPTKKKKEEEQEVWKWWEEEKLDEGVKWRSLEHKGPVFAPDYEPLPKSVKFFYDGDHLVLSPEAEEVATFYSKLLDHDYTSKEAFNKNFFKDWKKVMTPEEKLLITDLKKCNFKQMQQYFLQKSEERKAMTKEEKQVIKKENEELQKEYGFCIIDGHKEKIGNFKIEPPGLFRGRGEHPKMGMLKKRIMPEGVIINCSKGSKVPQPPKGHKWREVRHDNTVTWLACWTENIQGSNKYIMLNPSSKLKGEKDMQKYEVARKLKNCVNTIRENYRRDWKSKEMRIRQRSVALYFIDKLALRAGNEKEEGETADTVGCCSLRFEHITLDEEKDGQEFVVNFDFLGKDSIRYVNSVPVEKRVFKNLQLFMENKQTGDDLFDRLNTSTLNKHLSELMDGLTAKVFRTFNASKTLQEQLDKLTNPDDPIPAKMLSYNRANRAVAILCNHQRAVPKTFDKSMENLQSKIQAKHDQIKEAKKELKDAKRGRDTNLSQRKEKAVERLKDQLIKLELSATDKEENKQIALGTSKLNYLDPRITVAWCKKWEVPIEKVYNRTQRDKFRWAIEMAGPDYVF